MISNAEIQINHLDDFPTCLKCGTKNHYQNRVSEIMICNGEGKRTLCSVLLCKRCAIKVIPKIQEVLKKEEKDESDWRHLPH